MHENVFFCAALFICIPLLCMEIEEKKLNNVHANSDIWTKIVALSEEKNKLRCVCTALKDISSKNNCTLYACNPIVLTSHQSAYALGLAMYKRLFHVVKNLHLNGDKLDCTFCGNPLINLALYYDPDHHIKAVKEIGIIPSPPHYIVAAYFGDLTYLQAYCENPNNNILEKTSQGDTALDLAAKSGQNEIVEFLLQHPSINKDHNNGFVLSRSAFHGHTTIIQLLLQQSAKFINYKSNDGKTPLYYAAQQGHVEAVKLLCQYNADINYQNKEGTTPLYVATQNNHIENVQFLLQQPKINTTLGHKQYTPLHVATENKCLTIIRLLLKHSPQLINNNNNVNKSTALHIAVTYQKYKAAKILLKAKGVDVNIVNKDNKTPLDCAIDKNDAEMVILLQPYGAKTAKEHCTIS